MRSFAFHLCSWSLSPGANVDCVVVLQSAPFPMNSILRVATVAALVVCGLAAGAAAQSATSSRPSITPFSGTLLRVEDQGRVTVALATSEGILLADPLSLETARALKDQFAVRFPDQPVRYVVYTHHHFERASGASVFNQTAEILAHERFGQEREVSAERLLAGETRGGRTQSALYEAVLAPEESFRRTHVITLGGQRIALFHVDLHTPDMTVLFFPAHACCLSAMRCRSIPSRLRSARLALNAPWRHCACSNRSTSTRSWLATAGWIKSRSVLASRLLRGPVGRRQSGFQKRAVRRCGCRRSEAAPAHHLSWSLGGATAAHSRGVRGAAEATIRPLRRR